MTHLIEKIERIADVERVTVVTNHRFYGHFEGWRDDLSTRLSVSVLDDGTTSNEDRLGAIGDIAFALEHEAIAGEDLLVLAADNLFDFELTEFVSYYRAQVDADAAITVHELGDLERLRHTGVAVLGDGGRVLEFAEKPDQPKSNLAVPPFYIFRSEVGAWIRTYLAGGSNPDAPGYFLEWLVNQKNVYAYRFQGDRYDIGNLESYRLTQEIFANRAPKTLS